MAHGSAARKRRKAPNPIQGIEIALADRAGTKRSLPSQNWRHAMSLRSRILFRRLFVATVLTLPLLAASASATEALRPLRELNGLAPKQPKLSRLLQKVKKNKSLVDADVKTKRLTAQEGRALHQELAAIEKNARALAKKNRDLLDKSAKSLDSELEVIGQKIRT
jgi:hypothetical protein